MRLDIVLFSVYWLAGDQICSSFLLLSYLQTMSNDIKETPFILSFTMNPPLFFEKQCCSTFVVTFIFWVPLGWFLWVSLRITFKKCSFLHLWWPNVTFGSVFAVLLAASEPLVYIRQPLLKLKWNEWIIPLNMLKNRVQKRWGLQAPYWSDCFNHFLAGRN